MIEQHRRFRERAGDCVALVGVRFELRRLSHHESLMSAPDGHDAACSVDVGVVDAVDQGAPPGHVGDVYLD